MSARSWQFAKSRTPVQLRMMRSCVAAFNVSLDGNVTPDCAVVILKVSNHGDLSIKQPVRLELTGFVEHASDA